MLCELEVEERVQTQEWEANIRDTYPVRPQPLQPPSTSDHPPDESISVPSTVSNSPLSLDQVLAVAPASGVKEA